MLELLEKPEHSIYRILSDDTGLPEEELGNGEDEGSPGRRPLATPA